MKQKARKRYSIKRKCLFKIMRKSTVADSCWDHATLDAVINCEIACTATNNETNDVAQENVS